MNLVSFGFRYGTPEALELLFDVRFLPNPYFEDGLRERTGRDATVADYVLEVDARRGVLRASARLAAVPATALRRARARPT